MRKFRELLPPTSKGMIAPAGAVASIPRMFAHPAVGEVGGCGWECRGCHDGLSEDIEGIASKVAFMATGSYPTGRKKFRESLPPLHCTVRFVTGIPDRLGRGLPLARFNERPHDA